MAEFKLPELGENVASANVASILVKIGDTIARDQPVIEVETDKATVEVPSSVAGVVKAINVKPGDQVKVGTTVLTIEPDEPDAAEATGQKARSKKGDEKLAEPAAEAEPEAPVEATGQGPVRAERPPATDRVIAAAERVDAAASGGQQQNVGPIRRPPTDKAGTVEASPPGQGRRAEVVAMTRPARQAPEPVQAPAPPDERGPAAPAAPAVRRLAREIGIDINQVQGTGPEGRLSEEDVKEHARRILTSVGSREVAAGSAARPLPDFTKWGEIERKPMSGVRRKTAEHLAHAWQTIPHVTQCEKADITGLEELRKEHASQVEQQGAKLTLTAFLVKVLAVAVQQFPQFNAAVDAEAQEVVYKKYVNIGVAVDTDRGLLVPVIRNVDRKGITQLALELHEAAARARGGKLSLDDMSGGGITVSNLGGIGGTYFTPIVNWPEVAILGVSRGAVESVQRDGVFKPRLMLPLSLSYDHRAIDGADAMRFLRWVANVLEQPVLLALHA